MPKYYCDYCDTFLTHDSPSVRKTHNGGRKHKENVRMFYQIWMENQAQKLVDATARTFTQQKLMNAQVALSQGIQVTSRPTMPPMNSWNNFTPRPHGMRGALLPVRPGLVPPPGLIMLPTPLTGMRTPLNSMKTPMPYPGFK